ncbi:hypothetical protein SESBI_39176 [Sesbania bispinosa]|nr:hypothetical protein SESBI_39176 [Sesbania bispinosa]
MMNAMASASECSSGCESGWTLYLEEEHSFLNQNRGSQFIGGDDEELYVEEDKAKNEEEDLSMVSDASSGPPLFPHKEDNNSASKAAIRSKKRQKVKENLEDQHLPSFLDDTASSPLFDFSMNNVTVTNQQTSTESMLDYSQGFSATYFEERSSLQGQFGLYFLQPSLSENEVHNNKWYGEKDIKMSSTKGFLC